MKYYYSSKCRKTNVSNFTNYYFFQKFYVDINFASRLVNKGDQTNCQLLLLHFYKQENFSLKSQVTLLCVVLRLIQTLKCVSKLPLVFTFLLLLLYSVNSLAISASTSQVINGHEPYLTFDGGVTKATTTEDLLGITLSDGTGITSVTNTSSEEKPIVLPNVGESFNDIDMLVPINTNSIALSDLIGDPYNYWGDDDGDGQGVNGITITGSLNVSITDKYNRKVNRSSKLNTCSAPYKLMLTGTDGSLTTKYGVPESSTFTSSSVTYYISPKPSGAVICYAKPNLNYGDGKFSGFLDNWDPVGGFLVQSTESSSYSSNFPTTGANNLYFDLDIAEIGPLTWPSVTNGGITATMTPNKSGTLVRVTLTGPKATSTQKYYDRPGQVTKPTLPQTFELIGYDNGNKVILKYGFVLKQWFVSRGSRSRESQLQENWCWRTGYRLADVKDLTNAYTGNQLGIITSAKPYSKHGNYQRHVGAGFFSEWGQMGDYIGGDFITQGYWTSEVDDPRRIAVRMDDTGPYMRLVDSGGGEISPMDPSLEWYAVCVYP